MVVDGTQPASVNYSIANIDIEKYAIASKDIEELTFIDYIGSKNLGDAATDCVIDELDLEEDDEEAQYDEFDASKVTDKSKAASLLLNRYKMKRIKNVDFHPETAKGGLLSKVPFDKIESPISEPKKWTKELPEALSNSSFTPLAVNCVVHVSS